MGPRVKSRFGNFLLLPSILVACNGDEEFRLETSSRLRDCTSCCNVHEKKSNKSGLHIRKKNDVKTVLTGGSETLPTISITVAQTERCQKMHGVNNDR
jgi:hypothetical protein